MGMIWNRDNKPELSGSVITDAIIKIKSSKIYGKINGKKIMKLIR